MKHLILPILGLILCTSDAWSQGNIEANEVRADTLIGDGSRITGITNQNLAVSQIGDTLHITEGNFVIIPGLSASNSGNAYANAGADFVNACETSFNLQAGQLQNGTTGEWSIIAGTGGSLINKTLPKALFIGQEGESYLLQWTVQQGEGRSSFDRLNISIATNTETSVANAGSDLFAIMTQSVVLHGNTPEVDSEGMWEILEGSGGVLDELSDPATTFTGVGGETYRLRWKHFNSCSTSTDEVILTFSESASGSPSANGRYYIPDPKFRQYLQIAYPSIIDGDSLIVAMGDQVDEVRINNLNILNLDGLQYLTEVTLLDASENNHLSAIPFFSNSLKNFTCRPCSSLIILPAFPATLDTIDGWQWAVTVLPEFPSSLRYIDLTFFQYLEDLQTLPSELKVLKLNGHWSLNSLPLIPESCEFVELRSLGNCFPCDLPDTINIPAMAKDFRILEIGYDVFPKLPVDKSNLERLIINGTNISSTSSMYDFVNLVDIQLQDNAILKLDSLPFATQNLEIHGNPLICAENKPPLVASQLTSYPICP